MNKRVQKRVRIPKIKDTYLYPLFFTFKKSLNCDNSELTADAVNCIEPDRVLWTMQGERNGVAVKEIEQTNSEKMSFGTARVVFVSICFTKDN